jgi:hypothetical protein
MLLSIAAHKIVIRNTKIIVLVGYNQNRKAINFSMENLDNVSSIELIKVKRNIKVDQKKCP